MQDNFRNTGENDGDWGEIEDEGFQKLIRNCHPISVTRVSSEAMRIKRVIDPTIKRKFHLSLNFKKY